MRPRWKLVALFYALALGWVSIVALGLSLAGMGEMGVGAKKVAQLIVAFLYMPAPLVAALVVERVGGQGFLVRYTFQGFGRKLVRLLVTAAAIMPVWFLVNLGLVFLLGNVLHVPGVEPEFAAYSVIRVAYQLVMLGLIVSRIVRIARPGASSIWSSSVRRRI